MKNGQIWKDVCGNDIQAHGGCIIKHKDMFYWYGEHKGADNSIGAGNKKRVDFIGISCYSSKNLIEWKYEGLVLKADKTDPTSPLHPSKVVERPKVIYNEKNDNFVLWMHMDNADYRYAGVGVAVSDSPVGQFTLVNTFLPNEQESRDMTVFKDDDGICYLFHSKDGNATTNIARLNSDYTDVDGMYVSVLTDQYREAPAVFKHDGMYYMITSGCTGWNPNSALYAKSPQVMGKWRIIDNPCEGENYRKTFNGQSAYIFKESGNIYLLLDHWVPDNLKNSGYSILPVEMSADCTMTVKWQEEWTGKV